MVTWPSQKYKDIDKDLKEVEEEFSNLYSHNFGGVLLVEERDRM
jgi:hypothetical protein